ncbi:hypothetical protein LEP1GSC191_3825 [Leptospira borgpetersenii serovar Mini str. 201000851]|nr:hypothetical protein LEP1GSC191_3825 [Leptospira borgpetersenii serovar Mini str. 201000851]
MRKTRRIHFYISEFLINRLLKDQKFLGFCFFPSHPFLSR